MDEQKLHEQKLLEQLAALKRHRAALKHQRTALDRMKLLEQGAALEREKMEFLEQGAALERELMELLDEFQRMGRAAWKRQLAALDRMELLEQGAALQRGQMEFLDQGAALERELMEHLFEFQRMVRKCGCGKTDRECERELLELQQERRTALERVREQAKDISGVKMCFMRQIAGEAVFRIYIP